ncbi:hypothetical protein TNCV_4694401 [Trichonephila clavipes]|nr:hypothetical protein TNCV_4694401 [Trichonephila clavipes]
MVKTVIDRIDGKVGVNVKALVLRSFNLKKITEFRKTETDLDFLENFRVKWVTLEFRKTETRFRFLVKFRVKWVTLVSFYGGQKSYWLGHRIDGKLGVQPQSVGFLR